MSETQPESPRDDDVEPLTPPVTGNAAVDEALAELADLPGLTPAQRLEKLGLAHEALQRTLTDSAQAPLPSQPKDASGRPVPGPAHR